MEKYKQQALRRWAKDKPYLIKIFAGQMISNVQGLAEEFQFLKLRRFASQKFPLPHLPTWFSLYRCHRTSIQTVKAVFSAVYGKHIIQRLCDALDESQKHLRKNKPLSTPTKEEIQESLELLQMLYSASEKDLEDEFNRLPVKEAARRRMAKLISQSPLEVSFYLFITVPCWTMYRTSPTRLYRAARQGNFEALEKLLSLDQLMLHDPLIGKQMIAYRFNHSSSKYRTLLSAVTKPPRGSQSRKNILLSQVGLLSAISHLTPRPLTPQDLLELIAAYDEDSRSNLLGELSDKPCALARELSPDRNLWRQVLKSDKKM